jgi:hypothetical protein
MPCRDVLCFLVTVAGAGAQKLQLSPRVYGSHHPPDSKGVPGAVQCEVVCVMSNGRHALQKSMNTVNNIIYNIYQHYYNMHMHC